MNKKVKLWLCQGRRMGYRHVAFAPFSHFEENPMEKHLFFMSSTPQIVRFIMGCDKIYEITLEGKGKLIKWR